MLQRVFLGERHRLALQVGDVIHDKYKIVRMIGHGGMGAVYEGENMAIARRVAIKVLLKVAAEQHGVIERFEREAQAAGRIGNDHILEVLDMGALADGSAFMVMEYLDGENLQERIDRVGRLTPAQIAPIAKQLLIGLQAAHRAGIIHRDLKPENVFILREKAGRADFVKIIDFGISKFTELNADMQMTATGAVMGTPYYMSPEQAKGVAAADARSDLYAVGVIIYRSITGQVPFDGQTFNELLFKIVLSPFPRAAELTPNLDPAFESIIRKAMAREVDARFQSAAEFIEALDGWEASGAGVSVPPENDAQLEKAALAHQVVPVDGPVTPDGKPVPLYTPSGTLLEPPPQLQQDARLSHTEGSAQPLLSTDGSEGAIGAQTSDWTHSGPQSLPKRSSSGWMVASLVVLLLGAGSYAAYRFLATEPLTAEDLNAGRTPDNAGTSGASTSGDSTQTDGELETTERSPTVSPVGTVNVRSAGSSEAPDTPPADTLAEEPSAVASATASTASASTAPSKSSKGSPVGIPASTAAPSSPAKPRPKTNKAPQKRRSPRKPKAKPATPDFGY